MNVRFAVRKLATCYMHYQEGERAWGRNVARKYIDRVNRLYAVETFDELFQQATLQLHPLKGNRAGLYAMALQGRWRLIVARGEDAITVNEVTNHYGD